MPRFRLFRHAFGLTHRRYVMAPPGGRLFGLALIALGLGFLAVATAPLLAGAQAAGVTAHDPGVRPGAPGAGGPIAGLTPQQVAFFNASLDRFKEVDSVAGTVPGEAGVGLGPRFNMNSCAGCHAQPQVGGTSPAVNPQVKVATLDGATNKVPFFITANGPVREARFIKNPDGTPDGGVHDLFTIAGRSDAPGCTSSSIQQPNFAAAAAAGNLIFRIPTPTFGAGLIESIPDYAILANEEANGNQKGALGIFGHANREGNAGTITRFGWKAQNKSLQIFAGEAYLVEQGVSNELFPQERGEPSDRSDLDGRGEPQAACDFVGNPKSLAPMGNPKDGTNMPDGTATGTPSDAVMFSLFMSMLAPPQPAATSASATAGEAKFKEVGCALCHTPSMKTGKSYIDALSNQQVNLFSDLLVHHMGAGLEDGVSQGSATGDEFRTAPLWGVGQRIFFLHDGRTKDLLQAIEAHMSDGSEANAVIQKFNNLGPTGQQNVLDFLRSL